MKANNFAGIKYVAGKHPDFYEMPTYENIKGKRVKVLAKFAKYPTALEGIQVFVDVLKLPKYNSARKVSTPEDQVYELAKAGFATANPTGYKNDIKGIIRRIQNKIPIGKVV